jgi:hypothetical protein
VSSATPLPGVRLHPNGASWQVRIAPFPDQSGFPTVDEANEYAVELRKLLRAGVRVAPSRESVAGLTLLGDVAREYLERLADIGGRNGTPYSTDGLAKARHACLPWLGEPVPARKRKGVTIEAPAAVDERTRLPPRSHCSPSIATSPVVHVTPAAPRSASSNRSRRSSNSHSATVSASIRRCSRSSRSGASRRSVAG